MTQQKLRKGCLGAVLLFGASSCLTSLAVLPGALGAGKQFGLLTDLLELVFDHEVFDPLQIFTVVGLLVVAALFIGGGVAMGLWVVQRLFGSPSAAGASPGSEGEMPSQATVRRSSGDRPPWEL